MDWILPILLSVITLVQAWEELPKFEQLLLLYPGYYLHGGRYRDPDVVDMVGGNVHAMKGHNTASLRLSWTLNRYGGRHSIGTEPVFLSKHGRDSITGKDGVEYIYRNTAFGPFLAAKYGNPTLVTKPDKSHPELNMLPYKGHRGIVRLVSYRGHHAGGHVTLWDCDHFHQSRDWSTLPHIISIEFWETPDSVCPPDQRPTPPPRLEPLAEGVIVDSRQRGSNVEAGHNRQHAIPEQGRDHQPKHHLRHHRDKNAVWPQ